MRASWVTLACLITLAGCQLEAGASTYRPSDRPGSIHEGNAPPLNSLRGDTRNAIAWAPLADPEDVTVEGSVPSSRAWSTSKVLVIAAYLHSVADGDPDKIPTDARAWIRAALRQSDEAAIIAVRHKVPDLGAAMTHILRTVGDTTTVVPEAFEGSMQWSIREQVRFMAALANGDVVSPEASAFLLREMQPIVSQRWGLGTIGARAFKPGWLTAGSESRQRGLVGDFAVAIITSGETTGRHGANDTAHAAQLNRLAQLLAKRISESRCLKSELFGWRTRWC